MRKPPSLTALPRFPITAGLGMLAALVSIAWWSGRSVSPLMDSGAYLLSEPWRLVTSIFPHVSFFHLAFNVYWLWVFGTLLEGYFGPVKFLLIVLLLAAVPNAAELAFLAGGVGLSGVVYGFFGMVCVLSRRHPRFAGAMDNQTFILFVVWFFFCIMLTVSNILPVANIAHGVGAVAGGALGWICESRGKGRRAAVVALSAGIVTIGLCATVLRPLVNFSLGAGAEYAALGYDALERHDPEQALALYDEAMRFRRRDAGWYFNRGVAYDRLHLFEEALGDFRTAATMAPGKADFRKAADEMERYLAATASRPGAGG